MKCTHEEVCLLTCLVIAHYGNSPSTTSSSEQQTATRRCPSGSTTESMECTDDPVLQTPIACVGQHKDRICVGSINTLGRAKVVTKFQFRAPTCGSAGSITA
eukprot:scaffold156689_cov52-Prasinocladus_malaysianus.AAC.2